jgi:hypothetical protein
MLGGILLLVGVFASPAEARLLAFKSPTGNITCVMSTESGSFAQCVLRSKGRGYSIPRRGPVSTYDGSGYDDLARRRFVLNYGKSRRLGRFTCTSRFKGMTCRNRVSKHGFTISKQKQPVF